MRKRWVFRAFIISFLLYSSFGCSNPEISVNPLIDIGKIVNQSPNVVEDYLGKEDEQTKYGKMEKSYQDGQYVITYVNNKAQIIQYVPKEKVKMPSSTKKTLQLFSLNEKKPTNETDTYVEWSNYGVFQKIKIEHKKRYVKDVEFICKNNS